MSSRKTSTTEKTEGRRLFAAKLLLILIVLITASILAAYLAYKQLEAWGQQSARLENPAEVELMPGMSRRELAAQLAEKGAVRSEQLFSIWIRFFSDYRKFQAGPYRFEEETSPEAIAAAMISGNTFEPVVFRLTVPEGFTLEKINAVLGETAYPHREEFYQLASEGDLLLRFGIEQARSLEGYLYPATYEFTEIPSAKELIEEMLDSFERNLPPQYEEQLAAEGLSLHDGVIIASLIEREAALPEEHALISEVILNRLNRGIALAIDASIIYGINNFDGNLRRKDLKDRSNEYNTRVHPGLPPGPIGSPSRDALAAVLTPTDHGFLYYVVDAENPSQHRFSRTLKEHNRNVRDYVRFRRESK